jgi:riboflavin transporter FmnP
MSVEEQKNKEVKKKQKFFTTRKIVLMALFTALSYVVSIFDFPIFPAAPFLKLDFGNVFIMLVAFLLGPVEGVIVCVLKETLRIPVGSTGGVGELANMIMTCSYILIPAVIYRFQKGLKIVVSSLVVACLVASSVALLTNCFILFPLYVPNPSELYASTWGFVLAFNLIKTVSISVLTLLLYKRLSNFIKGLKL